MDILLGIIWVGVTTLLLIEYSRDEESQRIEILEAIFWPVVGVLQFFGLLWFFLFDREKGE